MDPKSKIRWCVLLCAVACGLKVEGAPMPVRVDASEFGFSPDAEAAENVAAMQKALNGGRKTVNVTRPGEYRLNARVYIDDDTKLLFAPGVVLKKTGRYDFVLVNRGADPDMESRHRH